MTAARFPDADWNPVSILRPVTTMFIWTYTDDWAYAEAIDTCLHKINILRYWEETFHLTLKMHIYTENFKQQCNVY